MPGATGNPITVCGPIPTIRKPLCGGNTGGIITCEPTTGRFIPGLGVRCTTGGVATKLRVPAGGPTITACVITTCGVETAGTETCGVATCPPPPKCPPPAAWPPPPCCPNAGIHAENARTTQDAITTEVLRENNSSVSSLYDTLLAAPTRRREGHASLYNFILVLLTFPKMLSAVICRIAGPVLYLLRRVYSFPAISFLHLGPLTIPTFGLMVASAMVCAYFVLRADITRRGLAPDPDSASAMAETFIALPCLAGIVGAKLYHELQSPLNFLPIPCNTFSANTVSPGSAG